MLKPFLKLPQLELNNRLQLGEVVAICDHLILLGLAQLEHEIRLEAIKITPHLRLVANQTQLGQISVDYDLLANGLCNVFDGQGVGSYCPPR